MRIGIVTHHATQTNLGLAAAAPRGIRSFVIPPEKSVQLEPCDAALGRLDVRPTLDGIEPGLARLSLLEARGLPVLNPPVALRLAHDKLATAPALAAAALPHPRTTALFDDAGAVPPLRFPFVVKPRYGSWGRDVIMCADQRAYDRALATLRTRPWFAATGAVAQKLVPPLGHDLRVVVAGGDVIGAIKRVAKPGEWRTNVALGATGVATEPSPAACELALAAAAAIGADLLGVDLLPVGPGRYVVLELNGAVDFAHEYDPGGDIFASAMAALTARLRGDVVLPLEPIEALGA
jgi:[lysine-biosynthesis-protein LysW]--L-2-aminoadipate ligase